MNKGKGGQRLAWGAAHQDGAGAEVRHTVPDHPQGDTAHPSSPHLGLEASKGVGGVSSDKTHSPCSRDRRAHTTPTAASPREVDRWPPSPGVFHGSGFRFSGLKYPGIWNVLHLEVAVRRARLLLRHGQVQLKPVARGSAVRRRELPELLHDGTTSAGGSPCRPPNRCCVFAEGSGGRKSKGQQRQEMLYR